MSQALSIDVPKRNNKYMAKFTKPQEVFRKNIFFVNYVKMLCQLNYVNKIYRGTDAVYKNTEIPISGEMPKIPVPYLEKRDAANDSPAARRTVG